MGGRLGQAFSPLSASVCSSVMRKPFLMFWIGSVSRSQASGSFSLESCNPCPGLRLWDREGESQPEPSLPPPPPPSNGLSPHGCPSGPGHRCVAGHGAPGAVCRHVPAEWPGYSGCSPGPGSRGAEAVGHQRHWAPEAHSAPAASGHCRGLPGSPVR